MRTNANKYVEWIDTSNPAPKKITKESKQNKNMKQTITESQLRSIIAESIKKYISEAGMKGGFVGSHKYLPSSIEGYNGGPEGAVCENDCKKGLNTKGNVPARVNHNNKYPTPDEARARGFKKDEYQDFNKPYDIWHKGKESMKVGRDKNPWEKNSGKTGFRTN